MAIVLITGVPGTGKTAFLVSELEKIAATGRKIFVDNVPGLKIDNCYRAGNILEWHNGSWLHIDQYKRTAPAVSMTAVEHGDDGNENWIPNPEIMKDNDGNLHRVAVDVLGHIVGSVPYESHKGALLVIDEAQRHFRPRPAGSAVPDHVAALEVHRHQGLDIWLVTQRPGLVDSNVRALCGKHIALRQTPFGRYKYEWCEVGDIENKTSRDNAARSRFKLPKHVFELYKSAEVHTKNSHSLPMAAKVLMVALPAAAFFIWQSYSTISKKFNPVKADSVQAVPASAVPAPAFGAGDIKKVDYSRPAAIQFLGGIDTALKVVEKKTELEDRSHPFEKSQFRISGRITSSVRDLYSFAVTQLGGESIYMNSDELVTAGYKIVPVNDCSIKMMYKNFEFFVTCVSSNFQPAQLPPVHLAEGMLSNPLPKLLSE